ncbi:MAG: GTP-binding protein [Candidatus Omnitrophota bacterium]
MHKQTVKIVIAGHIDHGKSTLIGRLLLDTNSLSREKFLELKKNSKELGKVTELAYIVDQLKEEREQDKTIDTAQIPLKVKNRRFTIIDTPGHTELLKNMITGATEAQAGLVVIDAKEGIMEQTRRHIFILDMLGINKAIFAVNKMDIVNYEKERFEKLKNELAGFLKNIKIKPLFIIPISAKKDSNISKKCPYMKWYKGPSLLQAIYSITKETGHDKKPLRFPIQDIYEINEERVIVGRLESGIMKKSASLLILPSNQKAKIKTIKIYGQANPSKVYAGQNIGIILDKNTDIKRGYILVDKNRSLKLVNSFKGSVLWLSSIPLKINSPMTLRCSTQEIECMVEKIQKRIDSSTLNTLEENAKELRLNETGLMTFVTKEPAFFEKFSFIPELGRFVIEKDSKPMGIGIVI